MSIVEVEAFEAGYRAACEDHGVGFHQAWCDEAYECFVSGPPTERTPPPLACLGDEALDECDDLDEPVRYRLSEGRSAR